MLFFWNNEIERDNITVWNSEIISFNFTEKSLWFIEKYRRKHDYFLLRGNNTFPLYEFQVASHL